LLLDSLSGLLAAPYIGDVWDEPKASQDYTSSREKVPNSGKYKAQSSISAFEKVQEQITKMRQK
jgi:hypothetical protein